MKTICLCAMVAAGVIVSGATFSLAPAKAADLGGSGGDLEERVAELEATTVRKGNRKVSLELYGQVNRALLMWDDGAHRDTYVVDDQNTPSRFGLKGSGTIASGWKSGFWLEFDVNDSASHTVSNFGNLDEGNGEMVFATRQANVWIESDKLGRATLGHGSSATDDLVLINLSGSAVATDARGLWNSSFRVLQSAAPNSNATVDWRYIVNGLDTDRGDFIRYDSPSVFGFILSTAWGENDQWDIALKYKAEANSFRFAGGIGYYYQGDASATVPAGTPAPAGYGGGDNTRREEIKGSLSAMHVPTGLYVHFAAGQRSNFEQPGAYNPDQGFWYLQGGVDRKFFPVGATTLYGEYGNYSDFGAGNRYANGDSNTANGLVRNVNRTGVLSDTNVDRWGLGVVQKFDASALEVYALYQHFTADLTQFTNAQGTTKADIATEAFDAAVVGARVKF